MNARPQAVSEWLDMGGFLDIGGRRIFAVDTDSFAGRVVLILHGFPASSFDWRDVVPALAKHIRVVAFDFLGYGLSDKPFDARYSLFEQADLAEAVAAEMGVERCVLVSHDMGDTVAAELLHRQTDGTLGITVERAILTNGSIFIDMARLSPGQLGLLAMPDEPLASRLPLDGFRSGLAETFSTEHPPSDEELDCQAWLVANNDGDRLLPRIIRYIEERRANQDRFTAGLVEFAGPLTALWGEQDPIAVVGMTERLRELRPDTEVVTWPDVGHWPSIEAPGRVADAIVQRL
jgi:pimeloyl-ACP methyl ester carboxylesterase